MLKFQKIAFFRSLCCRKCFSVQKAVTLLTSAPRHHTSSTPPLVKFPRPIRFHQKHTPVFHGMATFDIADFERRLHLKNHSLAGLGYSTRHPPQV
ncbi:AEG_G0036970.mRNA.1.CDS.1 [Saccharomyces cerevisiae]|nr:AEG_G0036970.mRNA.1.CDS.1 [Saccharomyces cerevisiae]CAI6807288.1 AEG_G0036970.mRNA.1.CDS.1 [Saccharomyces cerevisiae]